MKKEKIDFGIEDKDVERLVLVQSFEALANDIIAKYGDEGKEILLNLMDRIAWNIKNSMN